MARGAAVTLLNQSNLSTVSFESKIRDGKSGEIVAMFADREQERKNICLLQKIGTGTHTLKK